jgi:hypothetical protein
MEDQWWRFVELIVTRASVGKGWTNSLSGRFPKCSSGRVRSGRHPLVTGLFKEPLGGLVGFVGRRPTITMWNP